ncbi:5-formyltetrahydrofolate cyclo-ligase [Paenibacillus doosanensis]|uniref:5-formyltetrahydrofolate cyclo-ligase n=1 Tax=Paenibacillus doosanensis TaxID=1229154 RepID=UPI0021806052|nr:5-formyltetrahydrofolate cyclo-ligase [Paenibacillus doosanensis]MCS7464268.1 5-formyltetrahydrofolate cyclo-ligase [Paenibacillus doosanensis]
MNIKEWKIELRRKAEAERNALSPSQHSVKSQQINEALNKRIGEILDSCAKPGHRPTLFTYVPVKSEVDVSAVTEACWAKNYRVLVPKVQHDPKQLKLFEISSHDDLEKGAWNIPEPKAGAPEFRQVREIDVILVPGLAFDTQLGRLGYGGGFYDRFMQQYVRAGWDKPYIIAAAFDLQMIKEVPMGLFDFRLDELITEARTIRAAQTGGLKNG